MPIVLHYITIFLVMYNKIYNGFRNTIIRIVCYAIVVDLM